MMETIKKERRGGKRNGAGRIPIKDKKKAIFIYVPLSQVEKFGGRLPVKAFAEQAVAKKAIMLQK